MSGTRHIPFHRCFTSGKEKKYLAPLLEPGGMESERPFEAARHGLSSIVKTENYRLFSSCTHALEAAIMCLDLQPDDEVIIPSFTFMSAPNAVLRAGAKVVFADIHPQTMNATAETIGKCITPQTRAVIIMHYAGLSFDPGPLVTLCEDHQLVLIEDAAHCIGSTFKGQHLGTFGHFGSISFHHTKNVHCSEGGLLFFKPEVEQLLDQIMEKGTNRQAFLDGSVPRYDWVRVGSSFSMNALGAAFLAGQLEGFPQIQEARKKIWKLYYDRLKQLFEDLEFLSPGIEEGNGHIFFIKATDLNQRKALIEHLRRKGIAAYFHYPALHESPASQNVVSSVNPCPIASRESERLLRLPIYPDLKEDDVHFICDCVIEFFQ